MKQTCILILGMHRSGTSALAGVLNILGVYLGTELMKSADQNAKGFYENMLLYRINQKLLGKIGSSWDDAFYNESMLGAVETVAELEEVLSQEFQYSQLFAIKDPRLAYLFPLYYQALTNLGIEIKVVIPFRNPIEVAGSLRARNQFSQEKGLLLWAYHFLLSEKYSRAIPRIITSFDDLIRDPLKVIQLIDEKLDLRLARKFESEKNEIFEFLSPNMKHHNISVDNLSENVPQIIREIVACASQLDKANF
jgi:hypothetical protein